MISVVLDAKQQADIETQMAAWSECQACEGTGRKGVYGLKGTWADPCSFCVNGRTPAPLYITGEGRNCYWPDYQAGGDCVTCGHIQEDHPFPPVGWPSPNATTPCAECDGHGLVANGLPSNGPDRCSACGGSGVTAGTRVELRVPCPHPGERQGHSFCSTCWTTNGSVRLAVVTWQTLPVLDFGFWEITTTPVPCITIDDYDQAVHMEPYLGEAIGVPITLPGSVRPGQYVAALTEIEMA